MPFFGGGGGGTALGVGEVVPAGVGRWCLLALLGG